MNPNFKHFLGVIILFLISFQAVDAQILQSRSEVIKTYGDPFYSGTTKNGDNFLYYKTPVTTQASGTYDQRRVLFFKKADDGTEVCYKFKIVEPATETGYNIFSFTRDLVQIDEMKWKDFGKGIIYEVEEKKGVCKITAKYDNEVSLAKVYKF